MDGDWGCPAIHPDLGSRLSIHPGLSSYISHGVKKYGAVGSGKADQRGDRVGMEGTEPARCGDASWQSCRHVKGLTSLEPGCCQAGLGPVPSPLENLAFDGSGGGTVTAVPLIAWGPGSGNSKRWAWV